MRAISLLWGLSFIYSLALADAGFVSKKSESNEHSHQLRVMAINTEWLWTPHDKHVDGSKFNRGDMSPKAYEEELSFYASLISRWNVDVVALSEIENEQVAKELSRKIGSSWKAYFKQGRDTATGQDVAIITRLEVLPESVSDYSFPCGQVPGLKKRKCLSKVLGLTVKIDHQADGVFARKSRIEPEFVSILTSHFLSRRNDSRIKSLKRESQAVGLVKALNVARAKYGDQVIVMGDFNDVMGSNTMNQLIYAGGLKSSAGCGDNGHDNKNKGMKVKQDYRIDHVLYEGLACLDDQKISLMSYSDHPAVFASFLLP